MGHKSGISKVNVYHKEAPFVSPRKGRDHKLQVAAAHAKFLFEMSQPLTYARMAFSYKNEKGFIIPGSKYIGPFNKIPQDLSHKKDQPKTYGDSLAYLHDKSYSEYKDAGVASKDLYLGWADSDQRLMDASRKDLTNTDALATFYGMAGKKAIHKVFHTKRIRDR